MLDFRRNFFATVVLVGLGASLAACAGPQQSTPRVTAPSAKTPTVQVRPTKPTKPEKVASPVVTKPAVPVQTARVTPEPPAPPPPPPPPPTTADILGLDAATLVKLLPTPRTKRQEASAEVWQYFASRCVLHVFLYPRQQGGGMGVDHLEATDARGLKFSTDDCLAELAAARRTASP